MGTPDFRKYSEYDKNEEYNLNKDEDVVLTLRMVENIFLANWVFWKKFFGSLAFYCVLIRLYKHKVKCYTFNSFMKMPYTRRRIKIYVYIVF